MKKPTKSELYERIKYLEGENERLRNELQREQRKIWEAKKPEAHNEFFRAVNSLFGTIKNANLDHIDEAGFWFSFELENDERRQTYVIRHTDF